MIAPSFAVSDDPERVWMRGALGPTCIPFVSMHGEIDGFPGQPAWHGRYQPIDLDANNRHSIDAYCARHPDHPRPSHGWGVCRSGFGLQSLPRMTREEAERVACEMNARVSIGADPRTPEAIAASAQLRSMRR